MNRAAIKIQLPLYYRWDGWSLYLVWPARLRRQCKAKGFTDEEVEKVLRWYFGRKA